MDDPLKDKRHDDCVLKPMPEKKSSNASFRWKDTAMDGWNACVEEITK